MNRLPVWSILKRLTYQSHQNLGMCWRISYIYITSWRVCERGEVKGGEEATFNSLLAELWRFALCWSAPLPFPPTLMAVMNDKWRQISENRKHNPSKITGGKVRKETVNKGAPAFMGQPHRVASGLSRRRSCYSLSWLGGYLEPWCGEEGLEVGELCSALFWFFVVICFGFASLLKEELGSLALTTVWVLDGMSFIFTYYFTGCRGLQFSLAVRSDCCFCVII